MSPEPRASRPNDPPLTVETPERVPTGGGGLETREVLKRVRRIEIRTRRLVEEVFAGQSESVFKGRGMEFAEVRPYLAGDEVATPGLPPA